MVDIVAWRTRLGERCGDGGRSRGFMWLGGWGLGGVGVDVRIRWGHGGLGGGWDDDGDNGDGGLYSREAMGNAAAKARGRSGGTRWRG